MITINDLKNEIARAKRINGFVIIGKTQDKVYVTSNEELQTYQRYNEVLYYFYPELLYGSVYILENGNGIPTEQYPHYTIQQIVEMTNKWGD